MNGLFNLVCCSIPEKGQKPLFMILLQSIALGAGINCLWKKATLILSSENSDKGNVLMYTKKTHCFCTAKYPTQQKGKESY